MTDYTVTHEYIGETSDDKQRRKLARKLKWGYIKSALKNVGRTYNVHANQLDNGKWEVWINAPFTKTPCRVEAFDTEAKALDFGFGVAKGVAVVEGAK